MSTVTPTIPASNATMPCANRGNLEAVFVLIYILPALGLVFGLSFLIKRKQRWLACCGGRPGVAYPVNLVDEGERRWAYLAVFGAMAYHVMQLFDGNYYIRPREFADRAWMAKFGFTRVLVGMLNVMLVSLVFSPLLTCIANRRKIAANVTGIIVAVSWLAFKLFLMIICPPKANGATNWVFVIQITFDLPQYICYVCLIVCYVMDLVSNLQQRRRRAVDQSSQTAIVTKIHTFILIFVAAAVPAYVQYLDQPEIKAAAEATGRGALLPRMREALVLTEGIVIGCTNVSFLLHIVFIIHMLICYRNNLLQYYRGDRSWHFDNKSNSNASFLVNGMRYSGYQIAYLLYGYVVFAAVTSIAWFVIVYFIIFPLRDGYTTFVIERIKQLWPTFIVSIAIYYIQIIVCKFFFLQERGQFFALNNRRAYHIFSYIVLFFNVLLGLFGALKRMLFSVVFGTLLLSRLDRCLLMRGFEKFDTGHKAYLAMLQLDVYHNHPILKTFVDILTRAAEHSKKTLTDGDTGRSKTRYRNLWFKAYTLVNNPALVLEKLQLQAKQMQNTTYDKDQQQNNSKTGGDFIELNATISEGKNQLKLLADVV